MKQILFLLLFPALVLANAALGLYPPVVVESSEDWLTGTQTDYQPAGYSPEVDALVAQLSAEQIDEVLDFFLSEETRFAPTQGCYDTGQALAARLQQLGYQVEVDSYYTLLGFNSVAFNGTNRCVVGDKGIIFTSPDGGTSWTRRDDGSLPRTLNSVAYSPIDENALCAGGSKGTWLTSSNGGASWTEQDIGLGSGDWITAIARPTDADLYLAVYSYSGSKILKSTDGGSGWSDKYPPMSGCEYLTGVSFLDAATGWAYGGESDKGFIARTTSGGDSWNLWSGDVWVVACEFYDSLNGLAVGNDHETILRTTDGGASWQTVHSFNNPDWEQDYLGDIDWLSASEALAVGYGGCLLQTTDGGDNWSYLREPSTNPDFGTLGDLAVISAYEWFVVGDGMLESTTNGGDAWTSHFANLGLPPVLNIYASKEGSSGEPGPLVIANFDSTSEDPWNEAPGADANASGATAALTAAELLADLHTERDLGFLFTGGRYLASFSVEAAERFLDTHPDYQTRCVLNSYIVGYADDGRSELVLYGNPATEELNAALESYADRYVDGLTVFSDASGLYLGGDHFPFRSRGDLAVTCVEYTNSDEDPNTRLGSIEDKRSTLNERQILHAARLTAAFAASEAVLTDDIALSPYQPYVFPNPFRPTDGHTTITFAGMPVGGRISVYDLSGTLIYEGTADDGPYFEDDTATWRHRWNGTNTNGQALASGVYLYHAEGSQGEAIVKLAIIN